jgi:serine phosphatase RsbU (regulator of sigma subunit)
VASQAGILGVLFAMKSVPFGFVEESQGLFQAFANQAAISLENVRLVELSVKRQAAEEELRIAHEAQMRLLPQRMPLVRGFDIDGLCITANEIGGDFYDVIPVGAGRVDVVIGDVSGKGAAAAFYMAEFKGVIQTLVSHFDSPRDILAEMNSFLRKQCDQDMFLTMVYAILQPSRRTVRFARAGHCPVGLLRGQSLSWLEPKGLGLGLVPEKFFKSRLEERRLTLKSGDVLFFYTDGLTEARNPEREEFGEERLAELLAGTPPCTARELVRTVADRVDEFTANVPRHDDITMLALRTTSNRKAIKV